MVGGRGGGCVLMAVGHVHCSFLGRTVSTERKISKLGPLLVEGKLMGWKHEGEENLMLHLRGGRSPIYKSIEKWLCMHSLVLVQLLINNVN